MRRIIYGRFVMLTLLAVFIFTTFGMSAAKAEWIEEVDWQQAYLDMESDEKAIIDAIYFSTETRDLSFDLDQALEEVDSIPDEEVIRINDILEGLHPAHVEKILVTGGVLIPNPEMPPEVRAVPALVWGGVAVIGIIFGSALIFSSIYFNNREKELLIDRCYDEGGSPQVTNADSAGVSGTTDGGAAQRAGGYEFECKEMD